MNRSYNRWSPTAVAIGAAVLLLVVSIIGLATTTKSTVTEIERAQGKIGAEDKKDATEQTSSVPMLMVVGVGLGVLALGASLVSQYIKYKQRPQAPKEAWQKYT